MPEHAPATLKDAVMASPGPQTAREAGLLAAKGFAMGTADIIPGVSGGTVAFITGIYTQLLTAINSVGVPALKRLLAFDLKGAIAAIHLRFLVVLLFGIGAAVVSTARLMHYLMAEHPVPTWATFFGLILASVVVVAREVDGITRPPSLAAVALGAVAAYVFVGLIPVQTPNDAWFLFLAGSIAICAMILPGVSGSFLLLILGKYAYVTGAIKNPFADGSLMIIATFGAGAVVGLLGFSRVLVFLLARFRGVTMAVLTGFMIGALRKVWPWKEVLETRVVRDKVHVIRDQNVLPDAFDGEVMLAVGLAVVGFVLVLTLERLAQSRAPAAADG
jgi:putative membrane protein